MEAMTSTPLPRTEDTMNRTFRTLKMLAAAAMALTAMSVALSVAGPAQAYDRGTCERRYGAANIEKVYMFKMNAGEVDFGDLGHLAGAPLGNAVVCWKTNGSVQVIGRLFADAIGYSVFVTAKLRFTHSSGFSWSTDPFSVSGQHAQNIVVDRGASANSGSINRVDIAFYKGDPAWGPQQYVTTITYNR
jgi:hypothetical protein